MLAICSCLLLAGASGAEKPADANALLTSLQARYESIIDLRADFAQESLVASLGRRTHSAGTVVVRRPGRMRWEYREPEHRVIVLDRGVVQIYSAPDAQLQIAAASAGTFSPTALGFLLGKGDLVEMFEGERVDAGGRDELGLRLRPRGEAVFEFLELWLDPATQQLRESLVVDLFGNRTRVRFSQIAENQGLDEDVFDLAVPEGTEIIDLR